MYYCRRGTSNYLVERTWGSPPERPLVQRVTGNGLEPIEELGIRTFFPIKCFSQSEIIEFAREPEVRLSLTDDLIDSSSERAVIDGLKASLKRNAAEVGTEQEKERNANSELEERPSLVEAIKDLDKVFKDERIVQQRSWYREQTLFKKR